MLDLEQNCDAFHEVSEVCANHLLSFQIEQNELRKKKPIHS
jgi:hypothetical protein